MWTRHDPNLRQGGQAARTSNLADLRKRTLSDEDKTFVWVKRQVDESVAKEVDAASVMKGIYLRKDYKRQYPEGEAAAHIVGFHQRRRHVGQEGVELTFNKKLVGHARFTSRHQGPPGARHRRRARCHPACKMGLTCNLSIDSKIQFFAHQKLREAVEFHKAKAGSVVVIDVQTGEVLALANYPTYNPNKRENLSGEQLRNRALDRHVRARLDHEAHHRGHGTRCRAHHTADGHRHRFRQVFTMGGFTISDTHATMVR